MQAGTSVRPTISIGLYKDSIFALFVGVISFIQLQLIGTLYLSEIVLLLVAVWGVVLGKHRGNDGAIRTVVILGLFWFCSQVVTDLYQDVRFNNMMRGSAGIIFLFSNLFAFLLILEKRESNILWLLFGLAVGAGLSNIFTPNVYYEEYFWRFGWALPGLLILALVSQMCWSSNRHWLSLFPTASFGVFLFMVGSRSYGLFALGISVILALSMMFGGKRKYGIGSLLVFLLLSLLPIFGIVKAYETSAKLGFLGEEQQRKHYLQASGDFGVILGGRKEIFASWEAVKTSPILGHGSWAVDSTGRYIGQLTRLVDYGYKYDTKTILTTDYKRIPSHSYLMGAWVDSGLLGAIFWLACLALVSKNCLNCVLGKNYFLPLIALFTLMLVWAILFSPYGGQARVYAALELAAIISFSKSHLKLGEVRGV